jgi:hypothetical protein
MPTWTPPGGAPGFLAVSSVSIRRATQYRKVVSSCNEASLANEQNSDTLSHLSTGERAAMVMRLLGRFG